MYSYGDPNVSRKEHHYGPFDTLSRYVNKATIILPLHVVKRLRCGSPGLFVWFSDEEEAEKTSGGRMKLDDQDLGDSRKEDRDNKVSW